MYICVAERWEICLKVGLSVPILMLGSTSWENNPGDLHVIDAGCKS